MFTSLHINVLFADLLEQMSKYAKFLKEIISNKKRLSEHETVMLTKESSAFLRKHLPTVTLLISIKEEPLGEMEVAVEITTMPVVVVVEIMVQADRSTDGPV